MGDKAKLPVLVLIGLIIISIALAGGVFVLLQQEKKKNVDLQEQLEDIKTRLRVTENKLDESKKTISDLGTKLARAESQISSLNSDLQQEKSSKEEALNKIEEMRADLEQQKNLRQDLEVKFSDAQKVADQMQAQLKALEAKKTELETKVKDLEARTQQAQSQGVELGKIVVSPEVVPPAPAKPSKKDKKAKKAAVTQTQPAPVPEPAPVVKAPSELEGRVLVVNKDYNFVVISLGAKDKIEVGDVFSVYRGNKLLGDVKVEKVHDSMSAAGFSAALKDKVNEGDKVVRKSK